MPYLKFGFHGDIQRKMRFNVILLNHIESLCKHFLLEVKILQFHILQLFEELLETKLN